MYAKIGSEGELQVLLAERALIDPWNAILLDKTMHLERSLGMDESADSKEQALQKLRE